MENFFFNMVRKFCAINALFLQQSDQGSRKKIGAKRSFFAQKILIE